MQNYPAGKGLIWYPVYQNLRTFWVRAEPNLPKGPGYEKISTLYRNKRIRGYVLTTQLGTTTVVAIHK